MPSSPTMLQPKPMRWVSANCPVAVNSRSSDDQGPAKCIAAVLVGDGEADLVGAVAGEGVHRAGVLADRTIPE